MCKFPASEERVFVIDVPVDFRYREVLLLIVFLAERNSSARIGSRRIQPLQQLQRRFRILPRIDTIVREWRSQVDSTTGLALRGGVGRPVAGKHLRRRNVRDRSQRVRSLDGRLDTSKEEQFVFHDGPAQHAAELIAFQPVLFGSKCVARVEDPVAYELEETAMKFIGAALRDDVDDAGSVISVLCRHGTGLDFEFLQRIGKRQR